ncbi:MAG: metallophosphoesterase [Chloroflexota bacterium]
MDEHSFLALRARVGDAYLGQRMRLQVDRMVQLVGRGEGSLHFENLPLFVHTLHFLLKLSGLYGRGQRNALRFQVRENRVPIRGLPQDLEGLGLLHLSDLHIDAYPGLGQHIARAVSGLDFDVCLLTGDFRFHETGRYHHIAHELEELVAALRCPLGVYGILGNHDFIEMVPILEACGIRMLLNESAELARNGASLWLVGLDDAHVYGLHDFEKGLAGVPSHAVRILIAHSPELIVEASRWGFDLYLAGHTHAGQMCLPGGFPLIVNAHCRRRYIAGRWEYADMRGYTSAGTGSSGVFARFFCPPEIVVHRLYHQES